MLAHRLGSCLFALLLVPACGDDDDAGRDTVEAADVADTSAGDGVADGETIGDVGGDAGGDVDVDGDGDVDGDASGDVGAEAPIGTWRRVVPAYETEAACRAANPDFLFACTEIIDLCAEGRADVLHTDIIYTGTWTWDADSVTVTMDIYPEAYTTDGTLELERRPDGSLYSAEVYGERAFVPSTDPLEGLCQPRDDE